MSKNYKSNPLLKARGVEHEFTEEQLQEIIKCERNPIYFAKNYIKIVSLDHGLVQFKPYKYQVRMLRNFRDHRFTINMLPRQSGKSIAVCSFLIHYAIFNPNSNIAILANKANTARDLLQKLQLMYENLPDWLQVGVLAWNKGDLVLENGSRILASSTSSSAVRGMSVNLLFLDEFAFVENSIADEFFASVYPTITSGNTTKVIMVSTPKGLNHFYKKWMDAINGRNEYVPFKAEWWEKPGRDEKFKQQTIANTSQRQWDQEFEMSFLGSSNTLISGQKLAALVFQPPQMSNAGLDIYELPKKRAEYLITVDVARGTGNDYSAFIVTDISTYPHKLVAKYRDNEIKPMLFPEIIQRVAKQYNNAWVFIEVNDIGEQIAQLLYIDLQYENILMTMMRGRSGQILGIGFSGQGTQLGVKMSKTVKKIGCSNLKTLIEEDKFIFNDNHLISELSTFIERNGSHMADDGYNDDLVMCAVIYAWCVTQEFFKQLTNTDIKQKIREENLESIDDDFLPFGFIDNGVEPNTIVSDGMVWMPYDYDGYGDMASVVEYMVGY